MPAAPPRFCFLPSHETSTHISSERADSNEDRSSPGLAPGTTSSKEVGVPGVQVNRRRPSHRPDHERHGRDHGRRRQLHGLASARCCNQPRYQQTGLRASCSRTDSWRTSPQCSPTCREAMLSRAPAAAHTPAPTR